MLYWLKKTNIIKRCPVSYKTNFIHILLSESPRIGGFSSITLEEASCMYPESLDEMWNIVQRTCSAKPAISEPITNRKGWKTIRLFVSSTFKDFHQVGLYWIPSQGNYMVITKPSYVATKTNSNITNRNHARSVLQVSSEQKVTVNLCWMTGGIRSLHKCVVFLNNYKTNALSTN